MNVSRRGWIALYAALMVITIVRVASTHRVFCEVLDEPVHVATGMEWLTHGTLSLDPTHPPLELALSAIPLRLSGITLPADPDSIQSGNKILYARDQHEHNLALARIGNLLLLLVLIGATAAWARRYFPEPVPFFAAALVACIPPVIGHSGVATTDIAVAALLPVCMLTFDRWLDAPVMRRSIELGLAIGIGLLSKFSFLLFFPLAAAMVWGVRRRRPTMRGILAAGAVAFVVLWAAYGFSIGRLRAYQATGVFAEIAPRPLKPVARWIGDHVPLPAPEFVAGAAMVKLHDLGGHTTFLLGNYSDTGWWYYFPVVTFFKTPIPFLILAAWGISLLLMRARQSLPPLQFVLVPLIVLVASMTSHINIGIRHVLPIYPGLAICAAVALVAIWRESTTSFARAAVVAVVAWFVIGTTLAHPDYLAWFNEAAGDHPEQIVVDSNLDWGQDVFRLRRAVDDYNIRSLMSAVATNAWLGVNGIPSGPRFKPYTKQTGWVAVSETIYVLYNRTGQLAWLDFYGFRRIGKSIRLYYIPTATEPQTSGPPRLIDNEVILLPLAGTTAASGAPGGARWRVDQTVRNKGTRPVHVTLSHCVSKPCSFDIAPEQVVKIAGSDPIRPFIDVTVPRRAASSLEFSTVARRVDRSIPGSEIVVPAVPRSDFRNGTIEIDNVPFSKLNRLNLRVYADTTTGSSAEVRVSAGGRLLARANIPIYFTGYYVVGDLGSLFPDVKSQEIRATVTIEAPTRLWAFITETNAADRSTVFIPAR